MPAAMRQRFVAPPSWQPEIKVEKRYHRREATHASVLVPLVLRDEMTVLLTQRTDHLNDHPGQISFPGGRAETSDADATATALREAHEEIGLEPFEIEVLGSLPTYTTSTGFIVTPVVGLVQPGAPLRPDPFEVAEVFEVPLAWLMNPAHHQRHADRGRRRDARVLLDPLAGHRRQRRAAPLFHLGRDRGDAAQPLPLPRRLSGRSQRGAGARGPPL